MSDFEEELRRVTTEAVAEVTPLPAAEVMRRASRRHRRRLAGLGLAGGAVVAAVVAGLSGVAAGQHQAPAGGRPVRRPRPGPRRPRPAAPSPSPSHLADQSAVGDLRADAQPGADPSDHTAGHGLAQPGADPTATPSPR